MLAAVGIRGRATSAWTRLPRFGLGCLAVVVGVSCAHRISSGTAADSVSSTTPRLANLVDASTGWVLTDSSLLLTIDSGASWSDVTPPQEPGSSIKGVDFLDGSTGWVAAASPDPTGGASTRIVVLHTTDGGQTWTSSDVDASPAYTDALTAPAYLDFVDPKTGWLEVILASSSNSTAGTLFKTGDGGASWSKVTIPIGGPIAFADNLHGWVADGLPDGKFFVTGDGGTSWAVQSLQPPPGYESSEMIVGIPTRSAGTPSAVAATFISQDSTAVAAYTTSDSGQNWSLANWAKMGPPTGDVADPTASLSAGTIEAASVDGSTVEVGLGSDVSPSSFSTTGVPPGDAFVQLSFAGSIGWAVAQGDQCSADKTNCSQTSSVLVTSDEGRTWATLSVQAK